MQAINASTGRFFTKFSGMIASGVHGMFNYVHSSRNYDYPKEHMLSDGQDIYRLISHPSGSVCSFK